MDYGLGGYPVIISKISHLMRVERVGVVTTDQFVRVFPNIALECVRIVLVLGLSG